MIIAVDPEKDKECNLTQAEAIFRSEHLTVHECHFRLFL
jgi:hypothetical protein